MISYLFNRRKAELRTERDCKQIYTDKFLTKEIEWKRLSTDYTDLHRLIFNKINWIEWKRLSTDYTDIHRLIFNKINWMKEIVHRLHRFTQINF